MVADPEILDFTRRQAAFWLGALLLLAAATLAPFLGGGLLTDDYIHLRAVSQRGVTEMVATPDAFGFYRPVTQISFFLQQGVEHLHPALLRATNLLLHLAVICLVYRLALAVLENRRAALFATTAFVLTPKAPSIAVLWISARSELLMSLFVMLAVVLWTAWERRGGACRLIGVCAAYVLAFLSKETAALLPLLLLTVPTARRSHFPRRIVAAAILLCAGASLFILRGTLGALMPTSPDAHYTFATPAFRWARNLRNYASRMLPSSLALLALVGVPAWRRKTDAAHVESDRPRLRRLLLFAASWFLLLLGPVLPIEARSELYLYLPGFGFCLLAGHITSGLFGRAGNRRFAIAGLSVLVIGLAGYQVLQGAEIHRRLHLSADLVAAIRRCPQLHAYRGVVVLIPDDEKTAQALRNAVGGYGEAVLQAALGRSDLTGLVAAVGPVGALRIRCQRRGDTLLLTTE